MVCNLWGIEAPSLTSLCTRSHRAPPHHYGPQPHAIPEMHDIQSKEPDSAEGCINERMMWSLEPLLEGYCSANLCCPPCSTRPEVCVWHGSPVCNAEATNLIRCASGRKPPFHKLLTISFGKESNATPNGASRVCSQGCSSQPGVWWMHLACKLSLLSAGQQLSQW